MPVLAPAAPEFSPSQGRPQLPTRRPAAVDPAFRALQTPEMGGTTPEVLQAMGDTAVHTEVAAARVLRTYNPLELPTHQDGDPSLFALDRLSGYGDSAREPRVLDVRVQPVRTPQDMHRRPFNTHRAPGNLLTVLTGAARPGNHRARKGKHSF